MARCAVFDVIVKPDDSRRAAVRRPLGGIPGLSVGLMVQTPSDTIETGNQMVLGWIPSNDRRRMYTGCVRAYRMLACRPRTTRRVGKRWTLSTRGCAVSSLTCWMGSRCRATQISPPGRVVGECENMVFGVFVRHVPVHQGTGWLSGRGWMGSRCLR